MLRLRAPAFLLAAVAGGVCALNSHTDLPIVNKEISPDGYSRDAILAGGTFPGPLITAKKGEEFAVNVTDQLTDGNMILGTSVHWHGITQKRTNYADGPVGVSQCPITPNNSFVYRFNPTDQTGTYWYHSHFKTQYCDGLRGPLVIYDPEDPHKHLYDVDNKDTVITLADWYHHISTLPSPQFNSTLINGKGRFPGGPQDIPLAVVNVQQGKRYRLRVVSIACQPHFDFSIDGHQMTVIEAEGTNVQPVVVDSIRLFVAQRYSVVINANQPVGNYWIRSLPQAETGLYNYSDFNNVAILRYKGADCDEPSQEPWVNVPVSKIPLVETNLHPLVPIPVPGAPFPGGADININLNVTFNPTSPGFFINGYNFTPPTVPVLLQIMSGAKSAADLAPKGSIYGLEGNKSVEVTIPAGVVGGPHPIHLHGHSFAVVRSAGSSTYNYVDPVIRDVVNIGTTGDNVTIRFFTDNPGPWFLHCHIVWHLNAGFAVVMAEDVPEVPTQDITTDAWKGLCPKFDAFHNATDHY